jgi:hypothetical protein
MKIYRKRLWSYKSLRKRQAKLILGLRTLEKRAWREDLIILVGRALVNS